MTTTTLSAADLGYEDLAPFAASTSAGSSNQGFEVALSAPPSAADLGYEETAIPTAADLGYGTLPEQVNATNLDDSAPTAPVSRGLRHTGHNSGAHAGAWREEVQQKAKENDNLGYGEAAPSCGIHRTIARNSISGGPWWQQPNTSMMSKESKEARGYEMAAARSRGLRRMGHRSSFGGGWRTTDASTNNQSPHPNARIARRVTMDHHQPILSSPAHHTMAPRRSSLTGSSGMATTAHHHHTKAPRRVSFGGSDAINHVPKLHCNPEDKRDMWYDTQELNEIRRKIREIIRHERELDEDEDCWRGLEVYIKKHENRLSRISGQEDTCNQIILELQRLKVAAACSGESRDEETREDLQFSAELLLESATRVGNNQAAKDAVDALAIYMEDMDSEEVRACFPATRVA